MQTEPSNADPPKRRRRWFQFSLRTLMIGVTLLAVACGYLVHEAMLVSHRRAMVDWVNEHNGSVSNPLQPPFNAPHTQLPSIAWVRRLLGDHPIARIKLQPDTDNADVRGIRSLFPEADVQVISFSGFQG